MSWTKEDVVEVALKHGVSTAKELYGVSKEQIEQWVKDELKKTVDEVVFSNPTERKVVLYTTEEKTLEKIHELMKDSHNMENNVNSNLETLIQQIIDKAREAGVSIKLVPTVENGKNTTEVIVLKLDQSNN